jgi:hypothetical protein
MFEPNLYMDALQQIVPPFSSQTALQAGLNWIFWRLADYPPYKPWFCLSVALVLLAVLLLRPAGRGLKIAFLLAVPAHLFGLFLLAPTPDFRYSHVIFLFTGLAISRTICTLLARRH